MPCSTPHAVTESCPDCAPFGPFERNNYFTGKFLTELDFKIETAYHSDKLRHHHARLHGSGVVCGLKVTQDTNPACRDRFVIIEPGTAIDCCGREIVLKDAERVPLDQLAAVQALIQSNDGRPHRLQLCLRFRECPTEPTPVLYDDCGCDDTRCAPNRILESFEVDAILDAPLKPPLVHAPGLAWNATIAAAHASHVALHEPTKRLYVITADDQPAVHAFDTGNFALVRSSAAFDGRAFAVAVSDAGDTVYVALMPGGNGNGLRRLVALDAATLAPRRTQDIPNSEGSDVLLATGMRVAGQALVSLLPQKGTAQIWPDAVAAAGADIAPPDIALGPNLAGLALSSDGQTAYTLDPANGLVKTVDLAGAAAGADINVLPAGATAVALAVARSSGADRLVVVSSDGGGAIHLIARGPDALLGSRKLDHPPVAVTVAAGGAWAYVVERDAGGVSAIQPVSLAWLQRDAARALVTPVKVGNGSTEASLTESGGRLFAPFTGDLNVANEGGVAVVDVAEGACEDIFWKALDGCPSCCVGDCLKLATIENYAAGFQVLDPTDPADPQADAAARIARIDNRVGRKLLPSTELLAEAVECLFTRQGGDGKQGPPGDPRATLKDVQVRYVPCDQPLAPPRVETVDGALTLFLDIPDGCLDVTVNRLQCDQPPDARRVGAMLELDLPPALADVAVVVRRVGCDEAGGGRFQTNEDGQCELALDIPTNCEQEPAKLDLPHICAISWPHGAVIDRNSPEGRETLDRLTTSGFLVAFDKEVDAATLTPQTFRVLYRRNSKDAFQDNNPLRLNCYCDIVGEVRGLKNPFPCEKAIETPGQSAVNAGPVRLARFRPLADDNYIPDLPAGEYQIIFDGDQALGVQPIFFPGLGDRRPGVDADHMGPGLQNPPWWPPRADVREPTGDGVEGGTFLSWFSIAGD